MKYFFYLSLFLGMMPIFESTSGCRIYKFKQACEGAKECVWDSRGCTVGSHPLEALSKEGQPLEGDTIEDNFKDASYHLKKAE